MLHPKKELLVDPVYGVGAQNRSVFRTTDFRLKYWLTAGANLVVVNEEIYTRSTPDLHEIYTRSTRDLHEMFLTLLDTYYTGLVMYSGQLLFTMCFGLLFKAIRLAGWPPKVTYNAVAGVFMVGIIKLGCEMLLVGDPFDHRYTYFMWATSGYFLFDLMYILCCVNKNIFYMLLIYHHLAAIMIVNVDPQQYYGHLIIFVGELSNLVSVPTYHLLQIKDTLTPTGKAWLVLCKWLHKVWYGIFRVGVFTVLAAWFYFFTPPGDYGYTPWNAVMPVYVMGLVWTISLWRGGSKKEAHSVIPPSGA